MGSGRCGTSVAHDEDGLLFQPRVPQDVDACCQAGWVHVVEQVAYHAQIATHVMDRGSGPEIRRGDVGYRCVQFTKTPNNWAALLSGATKSGATVGISIDGVKFDR